MSGYLLDTNVLSEVIKKRPEPSVLARLREVAPGSVFTAQPSSATGRGVAPEPRCCGSESRARC